MIAAHPPAAPASPVDLRIVAVPDREAVSFAREAFVEAGWPATGVYRALRAHTRRTGLLLSVRDTNAEPPSAQYLLLALGEFELQTMRSASANMADSNALELLVSLRRTQSGEWLLLPLELNRQVSHAASSVAGSELHLPGEPVIL